MTNMRPLRIPGSQWESFIIPLQESSFWSKIGLVSVFIYLAVLFPFCYFINNGVYILALFVVEVGVYIFCSYKDVKLKEKEYDELILEEETGIEVQEETKNILRLLSEGKINNEEFNSRMANIFMTLECGKRYIPRMLLITPQKTVQ